MTEPLILLDAPEDELCVERGWVATDTPEERARDLLKPYIEDEDGFEVRPAGPPARVWMKPEPSRVPNEEQWVVCDAADEGAVEFWEFDVTDTSWNKLDGTCVVCNAYPDDLCKGDPSYCKSTGGQG
jgi:hypothetical protein